MLRPRLSSAGFVLTMLHAAKEVQFKSMSKSNVFAVFFVTVEVFSFM